MLTMLSYITVRQQMFIMSERKSLTVQDQDFVTLNG